MNLDLLNYIVDEYENKKEINYLIENIKILHSKYKKYYYLNSNFYFNDYEYKIHKSFLAYINEKINEYITQLMT